jgi:hypothetical protein
MALTLNLPWRGLVIPNAYVRIDHVRGGKREGNITPNSPTLALWYAVAGVYADENQQIPLWTLDVRVPFFADESPFGPLYDELKALPEFEGAVDC